MRARSTQSGRVAAKRAISQSAADDVDCRAGRDEEEREHERGRRGPIEIGDEKQAPHEPTAAPQRARHDLELRGRPHVRPRRWQRHPAMQHPTESSPSRPAPSLAFRPRSPVQNTGYSPSHEYVKQHRAETQYLRPVLATRTDALQYVEAFTPGEHLDGPPQDAADRAGRVAGRSSSGRHRRTRGRARCSRPARRSPSAPEPAPSSPASRGSGSRALLDLVSHHRRRPRTRADEAHVSTQDVEELRKLVEVPGLEDAATGPGQVLRVVLEEPGVRLFVPLPSQCVRAERPELQEVELATPRDPALSVEPGPAVAAARAGGRAPLRPRRPRGPATGARAGCSRSPCQPPSSRTGTERAGSPRSSGFSDLIVSPAPIGCAQWQRRPTRTGFARCSAVIPQASASSP